MFGALEPWHIILILIVACLLFGAKRMPDMARSVGQSLRIFKSEMRQGIAESREALSTSQGVEHVATPDVEPVEVS
ncbi:Sec-independent protein translocase subunit TatA [Catenulispora rubra]|uniref:Sec-independent protein translocase subunit TatA n=1 Tax=Catenulispora rubra TaxID=280293 RepID=UPI0018927420|nr:Sec-independent protein translocase subunit TatA [Catenulispora rubra]